MTNVYNTGTVSVPSDSNIVTGIDTYFQSVGNISEGDLFTLDGKAFFEIYQIDTDNQLRIKGRLDGQPYSGQPVSNAEYSIIQNFAEAPIAQVAQNVVLLQQKWHQREEEMTGWFNSNNNYHQITNLHGEKVLVITPTGINNLVDGPVGVEDFGFPAARESAVADLNNFPSGNFYSLEISLARQPSDFLSGRKLVFTNKNDALFYQHIVEVNSGKARYRIGIDAESATEWAEFSGQTGAISTDWDDIDNKPETATRWPLFSEIEGDVLDILPEFAKRWPDMSEVDGKVTNEQLPDTLHVDIDQIIESLGEIDAHFVKFSAETLDILKAEKLTREDGEALLLKSISENAAYQIELAKRIEQGEELTNAVVYRDPENGLIVNRAYNYADDKFTEASLKIDGVQGEVNLAVKRIETTEDEITNLSSELELLPGVITAKATAIVSESIAALEPAHAFNFFDSAQGWQAVNGTLTAGVNEITVTHGDIENATLNYEASENKLIRVSLNRTAGSGWDGTVIIERSDGTTETYANYVEEAAILLIDFSAMANYTGTITRLRLKLGADTSDEFKISAITIGKADATTQDLANITARVNEAELKIDANEALIQQRVTTSYFNENAVTVSNVEQTINALDTIIALEAKRQELIDNDVIQKATLAATFLNGQTGTIQDIVQSFEQDIESVESLIIDVQQQVDSLGITDQVAGLASHQIQTYETQAALLQQAANDLSAYLDEAETNQSVALAINQLQIDVSPAGALAKDIGALQAATVFNGNNITATSKRLAQAETDSAGNASAIEQLNLSVNSVSAGLVGALDRLDTVETTAAGTASALSGVQAKVEDNETGNEALFSFVQRVETTADAAKENADSTSAALNLLSNKVNHPTTGLVAANTIAQRAENKADNNANAVTAINATAENAENKAQSALTLLSEIDTELDEYRAIAQLAVDSNGNAALIQLGATPDVSEIIFKSMRVIFQNSSGDSRLFFDTEADDYVFGGKLRSTASEEVGTNYMELSNPDGFGPDNLTFYRGPKFMTGNKVDYSRATKANARIWHDEFDSYFGGSLSAGVLSASTQNPSLTANPIAEIGPFSTNGNSKKIVFSFSWDARQITNEACPSTQPSNPHATLKLQRSIDGAEWTTLQTREVTGSVTMQEINEEGSPQCGFTEAASGSFTYTDTNTSTGQFSYRVVVSNQYRYLAQQFITRQILSIISTEE